MNIEEAVAFWEATKFSRWHRKHTKLATGRASKEARKSFRALARKKNRASMMNMGAEKFHRSPMTDERTKMLFAKHKARQDAGWIRG